MYEKSHHYFLSASQLRKPVNNVSPISTYTYEQIFDLGSSRNTRTGCSSAVSTWLKSLSVDIYISNCNRYVKRNKFINCKFDNFLVWIYAAIYIFGIIDANFLLIAAIYPLERVAQILRLGSGNSAAFALANGRTWTWRSHITK